MICRKEAKKLKNENTMQDKKKRKRKIKNCFENQNTACRDSAPVLYSIGYGSNLGTDTACTGAAFLCLFSLPKFQIRRQSRPIPRPSTSFQNKFSTIIRSFNLLFPVAMNMVNKLRIMTRSQGEEATKMKCQCKKEKKGISNCLAEHLFIKIHTQLHVSAMLNHSQAVYNCVKKWETYNYVPNIINIVVLSLNKT
jgi:hypothetical protein